MALNEQARLPSILPARRIDAPGLVRDVETALRSYQNRTPAQRGLNSRDDDFRAPLRLADRGQDTEGRSFYVLRSAERFRYSPAEETQRPRSDEHRALPPRNDHSHATQAITWRQRKWQESSLPAETDQAKVTSRSDCRPLRDDSDRSQYRVGRSLLGDEGLYRYQEPGHDEHCDQSCWPLCSRCSLDRKSPHRKRADNTGHEVAAQTRPSRHTIQAPDYRDSESRFELPRDLRDTHVPFQSTEPRSRTDRQYDRVPHTALRPSFPPQRHNSSTSADRRPLHQAAGSRIPAVSASRSSRHQSLDSSFSQAADDKTRTAYLDTDYTRARPGHESNFDARTSARRAPKADTVSDEYIQPSLVLSKKPESPSQSRSVGLPQRRERPADERRQTLPRAPDRALTRSPDSNSSCGSEFGQASNAGSVRSFFRLRPREEVSSTVPSEVVAPLKPFMEYPSDITGQGPKRVRFDLKDVENPSVSDSSVSDQAGPLTSCETLASHKRYQGLK
jgi:hypothetical protein